MKWTVQLCADNSYKSVRFLKRLNPFHTERIYSSKFFKNNDKIGNKNPQIQNVGWSKVQYWNCQLFYSGVKDLIVPWKDEGRI